MKIYQKITGAIPVFLFCFNVYSQTDSSETFGKYYTVEKIDLQVPFAGPPRISTDVEREQFIVTDYQYACPLPATDTNYLYAIAFYTLKNTASGLDSTGKVNYLSTAIKTSTEKILLGNVLKNEEGIYKNRYCVLQKSRVYQPNSKIDMYVSSVYFFHNNYVVRIYVVTPLQYDENEKIREFFNSVIFE